jgi:hypothetical protein
MKQLRDSRPVCGLVTVALLAALTGCTTAAEPPPVTGISSFVGSHLSDFRTAVGEQAFLIYDVSKPVLGLEPLYNDGQPQDKWTIVAQCVSKGTLAVAVLPSDDVTENINSGAKSGEFDSNLTECG